MQILTFKTFSEVKWMNRFWICAFAFTLCCEKERTKDPYQSGAQCQWLSAGLKVGWTLWLLCFVEVFFFFALTSYLIVCGKVQKNYTTNTFSTRLPDKRSGPQEETALNKVKRWRWTKCFQGSRHTIKPLCGLQNLFQPPVERYRLRQYTYYAAAGLYTTHRGLNFPEEQIKINFYSTSPEHLMWFDFIWTQLCFFAGKSTHVFAVSEYLRYKWRVGR